MTTVLHPDTPGSPDPPPRPIESPTPQVLIPEVRQHARRRRLRNLAFVLIGAAVVGLFVFLGSGSPVGRGPGRSASPPASGATRTEGPGVALRQPAAIAVGPTGELYVADSERQEILSRLPNGRFRVIAGTGVGGYSGDGGLAIKAKIRAPIGMAVAPSGVLYFSQTLRVRVAGGLSYISVVRAVAADGRISTVIGRDPSCQAAFRHANYIPARLAQVGAAELTIGLNGRLDLRTMPCAHASDQGGYVQLAASGRLIRTPADKVPNGSEFCGGGVAGRGFVVFSCGSGERRPPRLMVVRLDRRTMTYPEDGSQAGYMTEADGSVVVNYNLTVVRVTATGMRTLATPRQIAKLVPGAIGVIGGGDVAASPYGTVYAVESVLARPHGCTSVIARIGPSRTISALWRSAPNQTCF